MRTNHFTRQLKKMLCIALAAAAVSALPLQASAVRVEPIKQEGVVTHFFGQTELEMQIYRQLSQAILSGQTSLDLTIENPVKDKDTFIELCRRALYQVRRDYPESFLSNQTEFVYYSNQDGYYRAVYRLEYLNLTGQQKQAMFDEVDRIVEQGKQQTNSAVELLQYFQETLVDRVEYDTRAAQSDSTKYPTAFHAYGALMEGKAVCQGYAYAFKLLCDKAQIPCWIVTGYYKEPHAWNYVWLNGSYYMVDLTWDDGNQRASDAPTFLAGKKYAVDYYVEDNSAPGVLAERSYFETTSSSKKAASTQQEETEAEQNSTKSLKRQG